MTYDLKMDMDAYKWIFSAPGQVIFASEARNVFVVPPYHYKVQK